MSGLLELAAPLPVPSMGKKLETAGHSESGRAHPLPISRIRLRLFRRDYGRWEAPISFQVRIKERAESGAKRRRKKSTKERKERQGQKTWAPKREGGGSTTRGSPIAAHAAVYIGPLSHVLLHEPGFPAFISAPFLDRNAITYSVLARAVYASGSKK